MGRTSTSGAAVVYSFLMAADGSPRDLHSFPTRRSSDLRPARFPRALARQRRTRTVVSVRRTLSGSARLFAAVRRSEEHTSELQSQSNLVCRLLLEKKKPHKGGSCGQVPCRGRCSSG